MQRLSERDSCACELRELSRCDNRSASYSKCGCGRAEREKTWGLKGYPLASVYSPLQEWSEIYDLETALKRGKHAITANKATVAWAYKELKELAIKNKAMFMYEATVMDGMPLFNMKRNALDMCDILEIKGILNRTTNFILEEMTTHHEMELDDVVEAAKQQPFVESDPRLDIDGYDAAAKIAVLANVLMAAEVTPDDVDFQGIGNVTQEDIAEAESRGNVIKLICRAYKSEGGNVKSRLYGRIPQSLLMGCHRHVG